MNYIYLYFLKHNFCIKPDVPREPRSDLSNHRLYEHGICIRHCQDSNSQPVLSQVRADSTWPHIPELNWISNGYGLEFREWICFQARSLLDCSLDSTGLLDFAFQVPVSWSMPILVFLGNTSYQLWIVNIESEAKSYSLRIYGIPDNRISKIWDKQKITSMVSAIMHEILMVSLIMGDQILIRNECHLIGGFITFESGKQLPNLAFLFSPLAVELVHAVCMHKCCTSACDSARAIRMRVSFQPQPVTSKPGLFIDPFPYMLILLSCRSYYVSDAISGRAPHKPASIKTFGNKVQFHSKRSDVKLEHWVVLSDKTNERSKSLDKL